MKISIDLTPKIRGKVSLGPVPGTPEYEREQALKRGQLQPLAKCGADEPEPPQAA